VTGEQPPGPSALHNGETSKEVKLKRDRLEKLADSLELFAKNKLPGVVNLEYARRNKRRAGEGKKFNFSMNFWSLADQECGFAGCAIGLAGMLPYFRRRGLKVDKEGYCLIGNTAISGPEHFLNVADFFGLDFDTAHRLFDSGYYPISHKVTPEKVAERIRKVLKEG
jgi:hypothetical protein